MPELPEVETLCRQLRQVASGARIVDSKVLDPKLGDIVGLKGRRITGVNRQGKALEVLFEGGLALLFHLRMTGRLLWQSTSVVPSHARLVISVPTANIILIDPRRFATLSVQKQGHASPFGIDPLKGFNPYRLMEISRKNTLPIKSFLIDQRRIAGIGNIYACEILHQSHINPWQGTKDLSLNQWEVIGRSTKTVLTKAIVSRGTTISDWHDLFGRRGEYQHSLQVYGREGQRCFTCEDKIQRQKLNGRGTYFCPSCQNETRRQ